MSGNYTWIYKINIIGIIQRNSQTLQTSFLSQNLGTWRIITQNLSKFAQGKGNQGIFTQDMVTQINISPTFTQGMITI